MTRIDRYLGTNFIGGCILALLFLLSLFAFLVLSVEMQDVGKGSYELVDAFLVVAYTLPALTVDLLPVTVLLGGLLGLGALANNLELIAMRTIGISPARIAVPIFKLALVLIAIVVLLQTLVIPQVEFNAARLRAKTLIEPSLVGLEEEPGVDINSEFWTRSKAQ